MRREVKKPETTENFHRIPVRDCEITSTITISEDEGIKALYCGDSEEIATYLFDVDEFTMEEAQSWVESHESEKCDKIKSIKKDNYMNIKGKISIPTHVLDKEDGRRIIAGYASIVEIDLEDDLITLEALKAGLDNLISDERYANIMLSHSDIQVGHILNEFKGLKTHVDDKGLFLVAEIRKGFKYADEVWEDIIEGNLNGFSIAGTVEEGGEERVCDGEECWNEINQIDLFEVSVCEQPCSEKSGFVVIDKKLNNKEFICECIECGNKVKSDKHCKDLICSECGGQMRRSNRPGPGKPEGDMMSEDDATKEEWTTQYINNLPDSAFAVIEPAYKEGETENKNARHLPYKDKSGEIDLPHYRNALARASQIKPITDSISTSELRSRAKKELEKHRDVLEGEEEKEDNDVNDNVDEKEGDEMPEKEEKDIKENEEETPEVEEEDELHSTVKSLEKSISDISRRVESLEKIVQDAINSEEEEVEEESEEEPEESEEKSDETEEPEKSDDEAEEECDDCKATKDSDDKSEKVDKSEDSEDELEVMKKSLEDKDDIIKSYEEKLSELQDRVEELENEEKPPKTKVNKDSDESEEFESKIVCEKGKVYLKED